MPEQINIKATLDTSSIDTSLKGLRNEYKKLQSQLGSSILTPQENQKILQRIGEIKTEIKDLTIEINRVGDAGNVFSDLATFTTPVVAGFTAVGSSLSLIGIENEKVNDILVKTTQITVALNAIQQVADTAKLKNLLIYRTEQLKTLIVSSLTFKNTVKQTAANTAEATSKGVVTTVTGLATKAQLLWNAAVAANPILLLVTAVAALAAGIFILVKSLDESSKGLEKQKKAIDGTLFSTAEARDAYNELQFSLKELNLEYLEIVGSLTPFEKELAKLNLEIEKQIELVRNEYIDALQELEEKQSNIWRRISNSIIENIDKTGALTILRIKKQAEERIKLEEESINKIEEINRIAESKRLNDITKNNVQIVKDIESLENQLTDIRRRGLDERQLIERRKLLADIGTLRTSLQNTIKLYGDTSKEISKITDDIKNKLSEIKFESDLIIINNETIKQVKILQKEQENFNKEIEIQKEQLKTIVNDKEESIKQSEKELDLLYEKQSLLLNENKKIESILSLTRGRLNVVKEEGQEIKKSIIDNTKLFEDKLKSISKEKLLKEGLLKNDELSLDTSEKQIKAQQLLLKEGKLRSDEITLQSSLYEQLQGFLAEELKLEQQLFSFENQLTEAREKYNEIVGETNLLTISIASYQTNNTEELEKQIQSLQEIKTKNDEIVNALIKRLETERKIDDQLQITSLNTQKRLNEDLVKSRKSIIKGEIKDEKDKDTQIFNERRKALDTYYQYQIDNSGTGDEAKIFRLQWEDEIDTLSENFTSKWQRINEDTVNIITDMALMGANAFTEILTRSIDLKFAELSARLESETEEQSKNLDVLKEKGLITEEEYNDKLIKLEEEKLKRSNELRVKQLKAEKRAAIIQIIIDTAVGVAKSLGQGGGLFGPGLAALVLMQGAIQSALVASQPIPEYEMGGLIQGPSHQNGGVTANMEGNEYVIRKDVVQQPGMLSLLESINNSKGLGSYQNNDNNFMKELKETILGITQIPVTNLESEYSGVQRKVSSIETRSRF